MTDLKDMTVGFVLDILAEFIPEEERIYEATQDDINAIFGGGK